VSVHIPSGGYLILEPGPIVEGPGGGAIGITLGIDSGVQPIRITSIGDLSVVGMTGGFDGRIVFVVHVGGAGAVNFPAESLSATATDRFADAVGMDPDEGRAFIYDGSLSRWKKLTL